MSALNKNDSMMQEKGFAEHEDNYMPALTSNSYVIDKAAEKKLVRKLDLLLIPIIFVLYLLCFIDRTNIGNARIAGLEKDLGLKGYDYNIALSVFYVFYILSEVPSQICLKLLGARFWITFLVFGFGVVTFATAFIHNYAGLLAIRVFLGIFEGGVMPACAYVLSRFYTRAELVFRVSFFVSASTLAGAVGGLLASGFLSVGAITGTVHTWRNIFFCEGLISMGLAVFGYFILSNDPATCRWLSAEEKELASQRIMAENVGSTKVVEKFQWKNVWKAMSSGFVLSMGLAFTLINISVQGLSLFTPTVVRTIYPGLTTVQTQLRTVPPYVTAWVFTLAISYVIDHFDRRAYVMIPVQCLGVIGFAIFAASPVAHREARFASIFLGIAGIFPQGPLVLAWAANNSAPDTVRGVAIATVVSVGTLGAIVATWSFLPSWAPRYQNAAFINLSSSSLTLILFVVALLYCLRENKLRREGKRDHRLDGLDTEGIEDLGHSHPRYMYSY